MRMPAFPISLPRLAILPLAAWAATALPCAAAPTQTAPVPPSALRSASPGPVYGGEAAVEQIVLRALSERGLAGGSAGIQLTAFSARLPITTDTRLAVERISYQPAGQRFIGVLVATGESGAAQRFTVAGRVLQVVELPVLARRVPAGEMIGAGDLQWVSLRDSKVAGTTVQRPDEMIGRVARRNLAPGVPVNAGDLKRPTVVGKGAAVTLILQAPNMQLTARGRALDEGAVGETVRVTNLQSRTVVVGVVTPAGHVSVGDLPSSVPHQPVLAADRRTLR